MYVCVPSACVRGMGGCTWACSLTTSAKSESAAGVMIVSASIRSPVRTRLSGATLFECMCGCGCGCGCVCMCVCACVCFACMCACVRGMGGCTWACSLTTSAKSESAAGVMIVSASIRSPVRTRLSGATLHDCMCGCGCGCVQRVYVCARACVYMRVFACLCVLVCEA